MSKPFRFFVLAFLAFAPFLSKASEEPSSEAAERQWKEKAAKSVGAYSVLLGSLRSGEKVKRHDVKSVLLRDETLRSEDKGGHTKCSSLLCNLFNFDYALRDNDNLPPKLQEAITEEIQDYKNFLENYVLDIPRFPATTPFKGGTIGSRIETYKEEKRKRDESSRK